MENINKLKEDLFEAINTICRDYETKQLPEFKVGQWYVYAEYIFRVLKTDDIWVYVNPVCSKMLGEPKFKIESRWGDRSRPATQQEIESHLRKIADEKGFKEGVKVKMPICDDIRILKGDFRYISDWLPREDAFSCGIDVIWRGTKGWVEIIPDKKPLPKRKEEFRSFLQNYYFQGISKVDEFLNEYKD